MVYLKYEAVPDTRNRRVLWQSEVFRSRAVRPLPMPSPTILKRGENLGLGAPGSSSPSNIHDAHPAATPRNPTRFSVIAGFRPMRSLFERETGAVSKILPYYTEYLDVPLVTAPDVTL